MTRGITVGSLFAGIGGFDLAFERAGADIIWQVEIDRNCNQVLSRRFLKIHRELDVRNCGIINLAPVDIITFGSPCQDLSLAGQRKGLNGERSGIFFEAIRIIGELRPTFALWENVPGALSSHTGRDFRTILMAFLQLGARDIAWRIFDAQYFGIPQRRRRIFLVADFRAKRAGEILFEPNGMPGYFTPRGSEGTQASASPTDDATANSRRNQPGCLEEALLPSVSGTLGSNSGGGRRDDLDNSGAYVPVLADNELIAGPLTRRYGKGINTTADDGCLVLPFDTTQITSNKNYSHPRAGDTCHPLAASADAPAVIGPTFGVRRLTPRETERLQGFPDDWTRYDADNKQISDSARYRMVGNSVAVPCIEWIARRLVESFYRGW